jgi:hypothetical protein
MENLDRPGIIELLGRLGAEDDQTVLQAARELHRKVTDAGASWDEIIGRPGVAAPAAEPPAAASASVAPADAPAADRGDVGRIIDRLLARKDISSNLREELSEMKRSAADGSLDDMDRKYVRALAKRMGA